MIEQDQVYHMDCFQFLDMVTDSTVDLAVLDPPYNLKKGDWDTFESEKAFFDFSYAWMVKVIDKLKDNASLYVFNTPYNCSYFLRFLLDKGLIFQNWITWDKRDGIGAARRRYSTRQETILFFTKSKHHTFNYDEIRIPYESTERIRHASKKGILKNGKRWYPNPNGRLCGDVWHISSERHKRKVNGRLQKPPHATPKPHDLIERIIKASSNENDLVLDCFVGTGTTAIVAKKLNRHFIVCDSDLEYVKLARKSLKQIDEI
ncbi:site-specific DNA-methyltransferase [Porphyromonas somerae]|uniref:DNA-methyltransferase n=1 Tax=Porphyromonas somerae TaxID=322095 RepID=UPI002A7485B2|nr:site-specific DNA-methyltransferase [Porphyromonas somerae]MDY3120497.1 site-specific DNA-methyltransferase [Porphyromonas somerae]MDY3884960.1 site-specific DNA-methyltransferase [Porphyromonas somerae]MDY5815514.1 site-specific DNA-methyltransferase [Porphyromonas somerae]